MAKAYRVVYELDRDGYWVVDIPTLRGAHTRARTIARARARAHEVIALITEQEAGTVEVGAEEFRLPEKVAARLRAVQEARQRALRAEADLALKLRDAASTVVKLVGTRDAGELLGLSHGRIHQLIAYDGGRRGAPPPRRRSTR